VFAEGAEKEKIEVVAPSARRLLTASVAQPLPRTLLWTLIHNVKKYPEAGKVASGGGELSPDFCGKTAESAEMYRNSSRTG
jgi:hypothetical protein